MKRCILFLTSLLLLASCQTKAQLTVRVVKDSLFIPWEILWGPDNKIWLTQKNGYICRLDPKTRQLDTLYHETATVANNEGGMLGLALHPQFPTQPYVYTSFNYMNGSTYMEKVVRYTYNSAGTGSLSSPMVLIDSITANTYHNGCRLLAVGDKLFISTGEAGNTSLSQNLQSINGKILRINLDGSIPSDNPIPGSRIWSWGHRNAQGLVMANGKLYSSEHGDNSDDEINKIEKGRNYGWPSVKGFCDLPSEQIFCADSQVVEPMTAWTPTLAVCGLDYYDGAMFPSWRGSLLLATLKDSKFYRLRLSANGDSIVSINHVPEIAFGRLRDVCVSPDGRIFISTSNSGPSGMSGYTDKIIEIYDPSVGVVEPKVNSFEVYPNPAKDEVNVRYAKGEIEFRLWNVLGQSLSRGQMNGGSGRIDVSTFAPGIYFLLLNQNGAMAMERFEKK
jgi:glucose/arabinose dehydrogenase